jgi:hypothetical protein
MPMQARMPLQRLYRALTNAGGDAAQIASCASSINMAKLPHLSWLFSTNPTPPAGFSESSLTEYEKAFYDELKKSENALSNAGITIPDDNVPEEGTLSIPDNTSAADLKAMLAHANASLGSKLTLTHSYKVEESTDEVAYSFDEVIQIDSVGKKYLDERKNVKADGKTNSLVRVRYVDGTTYYRYRVSTDYTKGSVNLDGEVIRCQQTIDSYRAEGFYSPSNYGTIEYSSSRFDHYTYDVSAQDNKIIVKNSYDSGSIGENTYEITLLRSNSRHSAFHCRKRLNNFISIFSPFYLVF